MFIKFAKPRIFIFIICVFFHNSIMAQGGRKNLVNQPFRSANIIVTRFEWGFTDSMKNSSEAKITITNKSQLAVKSVTLFLTGQTKTGITLQSGSTHTIKKKKALQQILTDETKTIVFSRAFNNAMLYSLTLKEVTIEYENGSLEILN